MADREQAGSAEINVFDLFRLDGRVAIITGGSKGLGESMAIAIAQAGATTVICSRDQQACDAVAAAIASKTGQESVGMAMDVTEEAEVAQVFDEVVTRFGTLDVLINSAGINIRGPVEDLSLDEFRQVIDINLTGVWLCCRAAAPVMTKQGRGSVVNIASALSGVGLEGRTPYCSAKSGLLGMTRTLALEWAPHNVRCNSICPGPFLTEMNRPLLKEPAKVQAVVGRTALNRWAEMHEIRGAALFLASDASSYVTGEALYLDGGWNAQ